MSKLLKISLLVFAFCFCAFAQTNQIAPCPAVWVTGPPRILTPNEPIMFFVSIGEEVKNYSVNYKWAVSSGKIVEGQATTDIKVRQDNPGDSITAQVEITGLPADCTNTASETYMYCGLIQPSQIDEFTESIALIDKARIKTIIDSQLENPNAQLYVVFKHKAKTSARKIRQKELEILNSLAKHGAEKDRITVINGFGQTESIGFWLVPAGASPPEIEDN